MDDDSPDYPDEGSPDTINDDYPEEESRYRSSNIDTGMSMSGTYSGENMDEDKSGDGMQDGVSFNILPLPLASLICLFCLCICLFVCLFVCLLQVVMKKKKMKRFLQICGKKPAGL